MIARLLTPNMTHAKVKPGKSGLGNVPNDLFCTQTDFVIELINIAKLSGSDR